MEREGWMGEERGWYQQRGKGVERGRGWVKT